LIYCPIRRPMPKSPRRRLTEPTPGRFNDSMEAAATIARVRAREGDSDGFRVLVEQNTRHVFRLAFRMTGNEADAEDVVQETFLRAYRNIARYDPRAKVSTWLHSIASNYAIDLLRKRKRRVADHLDDVPAAATPVALDPDPERVTAGGQFRARVDSALRGLSPKERVAFTLRHFEELSIREIAQSMGTPEGSVKNNIFRAVRKLRAVLATEDGALS
jgi:RNA polymerase sigma-70 factor (ECF subfamily)